jgi:hypothetical protein
MLLEERAKKGGGIVTAAPSSRLLPSSPSSPCPVCGRDDKGGDCRLSDDGALVLCHHGSSFSPPSGLSKGEVVLGRDFQNWAYVREADDGRTSVFTLHEEKRPALRVVEAPKPAFSLARLSPEAKPAKGVVTAGGSIFYAYSEGQQVQRTASKQFFSHHRLNSTDQWSKGAGEAPWPLYNEQEAIAAGGWLLEVEGEQCCDVASSIGLVAISQPGNKALLKPELVAQRYERLRGAGVEGIVYLVDNDKEGWKKGTALKEVAEGIGLPFALVGAADLWLDLPQGGSIDDLKEEELAEAAALIEEVAEVFAKQPKALATTAEEPAKKEKAAAPAKPPVLFEDCWRALEAHADELAKSNDSAIKQRSSLANKATDLGINRLTQSDLEKLIYAAQRRSRPTTRPLINGGRFKKKRQPFSVEGLIRHGLNMLVSNAGVGKSRMCGSLAAAWLNGLPTWLDRKLSGPPVEERQVLIIGTDQTQEDWAITLEPFGLCKSLDPFGGDEDEEMDLDPRVTLHTLEVDTKLDADGLAIIRQWADNHPNCMIIVDSFTAILPPGIDEEKPSAAQPLYQLQEAMGTCWCIVNHHMRKAAGKEGSLGVGAGRGSSAIDGAVSRFLTLSPIYKMENGVMVAQESDTRRQLVSTKRGGATEHLIVDSSDWSLQGTAEALKTEERRERAKGGLNEEQQACLDVLLEAPDKCHTTREVAEAIGIDWADEKKTTNVRRWLTRLVALGLVDRFSVGGIGTFKVKP